MERTERHKATTATMQPPLMTVAECADLARVSQSYIRKLIARGAIVAVRVGETTGPLRIPTESFEKWLFAGGPSSRRRLGSVVAEPLLSASPAAIHEAAHEFVALKFGCRDVHAFVRSPESGICYHRLPPTQRWDLSIGRWRTDDLARVRARAAVSMAGEIAEAMLESRSILDYEALLTRESADPIFDEFAFEYGSLEEVFNHAVSVFGDHKVAARWLKAALPGVRSKTHRVLQENWERLLRRAAELDGSLMERDAG